MFSSNKLGLHFIATASASLLYVLTLGPDSLRERATAFVRSKASVKRTIATLRWILGFSTALEINNFLSSWARNNWLLQSSKEQWKWPDEVAVVTGGSGGIGALVVKGLAEKGVKVAVLDVNPLPEHLTKCECATGPECR
jgi:3-oxoacyl-ACP reductase-like protein